MPTWSSKNWESEYKEPMVSRIIQKFRREIPLRERIGLAMHRLRVQANRLENASLRMQRRDREFFDKCIAAQISKDSARASLYANECAEIRKMAKITLRCQLALEQVILRLETIQEFGDIAALMGPVATVVNTIRTQIAGVMPEVSYELGEVSEVLNSVAIEIGEASGQTFNFETSSEEAQKILNEASMIAEQRMKERFPELPASISARERIQDTGIQKKE
ncbi:MAG: Snf7 family protein [Candidatus Bathyarchaeia archaeon]